jgi:hypothetical protein
MDITLFTAVVCAVAVVTVLLVRAHYRKGPALYTDEAFTDLPVLTPRTTAEEQQSERLNNQLNQQLEAVTRDSVTFYASKVMAGGEFEVFRAAMSVTRQSFPSGPYPFYVFPQVSLGQVIRTRASVEWQADQAHRAINSKRCDLLIADRYGNPVAVLEYQGGGHNIGGTAERRDRVKRIALERAGVRYVEIKDGTSQAEIQQIIRVMLAKLENKAAEA